MKHRNGLVFLQLPQLENVVKGPAENLHLAAVYLRHALERSGESRHYRVISLPPGIDCLDDRHVVAQVVKSRPAAIVATLYLWNIERSLHVLETIRRAIPHALIVVGGPEVAHDHPFLFKCRSIDAAAIGEGEPVFPAILRAWRLGRKTDFRAVAWREGKRWAWGGSDVQSGSLEAVLPPPGYRHSRLISGHMGYLETSRGCPWRCVFCCYNQRRRGVSFLTAADVLARTRALKELGANEIRFIDPTFNSNPQFPAVLRGLAALNRNHSMKFFAEIRPETLTPAQAALLTAANFTDVEVGIQSTDRGVLARIRRQTDLEAAERGVGLLSRAGVRITLDIMCGLPGQTLGDLRRSLRWASKIRRVNIQFLHTLLLPGSEIRTSRRRWRLKAIARPPYRVLRTPSLSEQDVRRAEALARRHAGRQMDCPSARFIGQHLPDLFPERVAISVDRWPDGSAPIALWRNGKENRRALVFKGRDLFGRRQSIARIVRQAMTKEPHMLWQFVLAPGTEQPLDLLDVLVAEIDRVPPHLLDRMTVPEAGPRHAARRVLVRLSRHGSYSRSWIDAVEDCLRRRFY